MINLTKTQGSSAMKKHVRLWLHIGLVVLGTRLVADAAGPQWMSYQGVLKNSGGQLLGATTATVYTVRFNIYSAATGGTPLWSEQQAVAVDAGHYSVYLGSGEALLSPQPALYTLFRGATNRYIGKQVQFTSGGAFVEIFPRQQIAAMPFAMRALGANRLMNNQGETLTRAEGNQVIVNGQVRVIGTLQVTSIQADGSQLTNLDASGFSLGTVPAARLPSLPAQRVTAGSFLTSQVDNLSADLIRGVVSVDRIPNLPASKFGSGVFSLSSGLTLPASLIVPRTSQFFIFPITTRLSGDRMPMVPAERFTSGILPVDKGGTGAGSFVANRVLYSSNPGGQPATASQIRWDFRSSHWGLRVYSPAGAITDDFPSGWSGIATWDIIAAGIRADSWSTRSDARLKTNIVSLSEEQILSRVLQLRPVMYEMIEQPGATRFGFIAQELQEILPELVMHDDNEASTLSIRNSEMTALLVRALQEQQELIAAQHAEWQSLTGQLDLLEAELEELLERAEQRHAEGGAL
jgi:hypothetical protein